MIFNMIAPGGGTEVLEKKCYAQNNKLVFTDLAGEPKWFVAVLTYADYETGATAMRYYIREQGQEKWIDVDYVSLRSGPSWSFGHSSKKYDDTVSYSNGTLTMDCSLSTIKTVNNWILYYTI